LFNNIKGSAMKHSLALSRQLACVATLAALTSTAALAQTTTASGDSSYSGADSWLPYTTAGYIGLSVGNGKLNTSCVAGQSCDDPNGAVHIYTGGMFSPYFGVQLGYFQLGNADRNGDTTKVSGVNLVLTGVAPLGSNFSLVGRVGGTYGWTKTSVGLGVPAASGDENGFGASYGAGLSWDFNRNWSATLDWDRHHLKYAGDQKENTDVATIGLKYRF
jgi:opacity protein-like surface antigen